MMEQPRHPAGSPQGGEWSKSGVPEGGASYVRKAKRVQTVGVDPKGFPADDAVRMGDMNPEGVAARVREDQRELDDETAGAFYDYIARGDYQEMNTELRKHPRWYAKSFATADPKNMDDLPRKMALMQQELLEPLAEPVIVYRSTRLPAKAEAKLDTPGAMLRLGGFHSTSINPTTATGFGGTHLLEIRAKQGRHLSDSAEDEILLPHGAKFRVVGKKTVKALRSPLHGMTPREEEMTVIQLEQVEI